MSVLGTSNTAVASNAIVLGPYDTDNSNAYGISSNLLTLQIDNIGGGLAAEQSNDGVTWYNIQPLTVTGVVTVNVNARYVRIKATASGTPVVSARLSNSSLPLSGTVTPTSVADGGNSTLGAKSDVQATDTTSSWSVISLLKGIFEAIFGAITPVTTSAQAASLILKSSAGKLYETSVTSSGTAGYLLVFDATSVPANGTVTPKIAIPLGTNTSVTKSFNKPMQFSTGIVSVFSSTGPFTLTSSASAFLSGLVK